MLNRAAGFSLFDLMVAVAVTALLAALALPGFERQLQRVRRADALVATWRVQTAQERHRGTAPRYGRLDEIGVGTLSDGGHYLLAIEQPDARGFDLWASAIGAQVRDQACRHLRLQSRDLTLAYASGPDREVGNGPDENRRCWGQP